MLPKTIIHLLSGGLDSVTMLYDLKAQGHAVHCLLCDYKQAHVRELEFARFHCQRQNVRYTTLNVPSLDGLSVPSWIVPNRNAVLLSLAVNVAVKAGYDTVTIGCNAEDAENFPDCRKAFLDAMNVAVQAAGYSIEICAPYLSWAKWKIARLASDMAIPAGSIWTCYRGGETPCGECPACKKLESALNGLGASDAQAASPLSRSGQPETFV